MELCAICKRKLKPGEGQISPIALKPKVINELLCYPCYSVKVQVKMHNARARKLGCSATLTVEEWNSALADFFYRCAYCFSEEDICLEHFLPLALGGSTSRSNCVPACKGCNRKKKGTHPDKVTLISKEDIERVRIYLQQFK